MTNTCMRVRNTSGANLYTIYTTQRWVDVSMSNQVVFLDVDFCSMFQSAQSREAHPPNSWTRTELNLLWLPCQCRRALILVLLVRPISGLHDLRPSFSILSVTYQQKISCCSIIFLIVPAFVLPRGLRCSCFSPGCPQVKKSLCWKLRACLCEKNLIDIIVETYCVY